MDKVYIVEDGAYSDSHIHGVYKTMKEAETVAATLNCGRANGWTFGTVEDTIQLWNVYFHKNGDIKTIMRGFEHSDDVGVYDMGELKVICRAFTKDKAIKIAVDMRIQYIAKQAGIT